MATACRLCDHRAPEADQEPRLRAAGLGRAATSERSPSTRGVLAGLQLPDGRGEDRDQAPPSGPRDGDDRRPGPTTRSRRSSRTARCPPAARTTGPGTAAPTPERWRRTASTTRRSISRTRATRSCFANKIIVDTQPPTVLSATALKPVLFAGPGRSVAIRYAFSEQAHAARLPRRPADHPRPHDPAGATRSSGPGGSTASRFPQAGTSSRSARRISPGTRRPPRSARTSRSSSATSSSLRSGSPSAAAAGSTVHVETALRRYTWRLGHRHGERRGKVLRLRAPSTPGTYRLVVGRARAKRDGRRAGARSDRARARSQARSRASASRSCCSRARAGTGSPGSATPGSAASCSRPRSRRRTPESSARPIAGVVVLGPLLAWLFRREPWLDRLRHARVRPVPRRLPRPLAPRAALRGGARGRRASALAARRR